MKKVILAAGGTGGHIFPAQAIAERLLEQGMQPILVCDDRTEQFLQGGLRQIPKLKILSGKMTGGIMRKLCSLGKLMLSTVMLLNILRREKPDLVIGFGGYPSIPALVAAKVLRIKTMLCEQNAVLGNSNRLLVRFCSKICLTFPETKKLTEIMQNKAIVTGTPVRQSILSATKGRNNKHQSLGTILVIGGSQGAMILSKVVPVAINMLPTHMQRKLNVVQQTRPELISEVISEYAKSKCQNTVVQNFFDNIADLLQEADLIICRAGASFIAEIATLGKAAILVPLIGAVDNHQYYNALHLVQAGAARLIEEKDLSPEILARMIEYFANHPEEITKMGKLARKFSQAKATDKIYETIKSLV